MVNTQQMNMFWQSKLFALIATLSGFARLRVIKILIYSKEIFPRWEQYACWIIDIRTRLQNAHMDSVCPRKSQVAFEKGSVVLKHIQSEWWHLNFIQPTRSIYSEMLL